MHKKGKWLIYTAIFILILSFYGCGLPGGRKKDIPKIEMIVENTLSEKRMDEFIVLRVSDLKEMAPNFSKDTFIVIQADTNQEIPSQVDDMNNDGEGDEIAMIISLEPKEKKRIIMRYSPESPENRSVTLGHKKRTRSAIHPEYEGISWESEIIGYRLYPDQRNSISVFAKQKPELSLDKIAFKQPSSAKLILDGKNSVGCGGFGLWHDGKLIKPSNDVMRYTRVVSDGPIRAIAQVIYDKWALGNDMLRVTATYSIFAGQRWCVSNIKVTGSNKPVKIASGLAKVKTDIIKDEKKGFMYEFDKPLGMGMIYSPENLDTFQESGESNLIVLNP
ncbi:TPA: DUF4861 domain-containing protein, partial [bacterium]|nr:DUF4861 domain-containing protein [bacterium]